VGIQDSRTSPKGQELKDLWALDALSQRMQAGTAELSAIAEDLEHRRSAVSMADAATSEARRRTSSLRRQGAEQADDAEGGRLAATEKELAREERQRAELLADYESHIAEAGKSRAKLHTQLEKLRKEAARLREGIPAALLAQYDDSAAEQTPALSRLRDGSQCGGCQAGLPDDLVLEVRESGAVEICPRCHRLLCPDAPAGEPSSTPRPDATGWPGRRHSRLASGAPTYDALQ
jgi:predicted  nucleic acid-binding Zn-ribbon protein